jgi:hypothetical protein
VRARIIQSKEENMARVATSQLPREATAINTDDRFLVDQPSVLNPVTETLGDTRKVSPAVLAAAIIEQESVVDFVDEKVGAEHDRAAAAEEALAEAVQQAQDTADEAVAGVTAINQELPGKANKIITPQTRTLAQADVGNVLGIVTFDTTQAPFPPPAAGNIVLADGGRFDLAANGDFTFTGAAGEVTQIITGGAWTAASVNAGTTAIASENNANSGVWTFGTWVFGHTEIDLADVKQLADTAQFAANAAAVTAAAALPRAEVVNDLATGGTDKALSAEQGKTLAAQITGLSSGQAGRGVVRNAYTPQGESYRVTQADLSEGGSGYAAGDALFLHSSGSFIPATVIVTAVDGSGAITAAELSMPGSFPADVSGEDVELAGGGGAGAAFDITAVSEPNTTLADISNPAPNDFAFVLED